MNTQALLSLLKICGATFFGVLATAGYLSHDQASTLISDLETIIPAALSLASIAASAYSHYNMKKVPVNSVAIAKEDTQGSVIKGVSVTVPGGLAKVVGTLFLAIVLSQFVADRASAQTPSGACNIQTLFSGVTISNIRTKFGACGASDFQAALDDANSVPIDNVAIACLKPASDLISALNANTKSGNGGLIFAFQKFRRAKQSGIIGNCNAYVQTTIALQ